MATNNKGLNQPALGSANWGTPLNENATIIDDALGSFAIVTGTSGSITLTEAQYQNMCLKSGSTAFLANVTFVIPSGIKGQWVVINRSAASDFDLRIKNAADAALVTIPRGEVRTVYSDGDSVFLINTPAVIPVEVPAGAVSMFAMDTAPAGWLKANGASISRTTYADLFAAIGTTFGSASGSTFNVPDIRGEFMRGWSDGRSIDSGRVFGSVQTDAIRNITGVVGVAAQTSGFVGAFETGTSTSRLGGGQDFTTQRIEFDASNVVPTATENRPRNIALLACIKY